MPVSLTSIRKPGLGFAGELSHLVLSCFLWLSHDGIVAKPPPLRVGCRLVQIRRKATPRELAKQFRGHGLKQAEWAPIPIYWAKDGSPAIALDAAKQHP